MQLEIPDEMWQRIVTAFASIQGPVEGQSDEDFTKGRIFTYIKAVVNSYETREALRPAPEIVKAAAVKVDDDFKALIPVAAPPIKEAEAKVEE